jgi:outer membrane lipoprotein LolB
MTLFIRITLSLLALMLINGCSTQPRQAGKLETNQTIEQRNDKLSQLNDWQFKGKIAFIQSDKRQSASIIWQHQQSINKQTLDLTSYLGVNVLHLESNNNSHIIEVDGESYQGSNLEQLIYSLTGLTIPTDALSYWLKGLSYNINDTINYHFESKLPSIITSEYNNEHWQITYANYRQINDVQLATTFTFKRDDLLIKISINEWTLP